jgi:glycosyltransferase involved in cell wall biosynthesis
VSGTPLLSVVMPVYNEAATVLECVKRVLAVPIDKELIIVDDGSSDGTREILARDVEPLGARVFYQEKNQGKGAAVRRGFAEMRGQIGIIQDADLEYNPNEYGSIIEPILSNRADVVYGSRFLSGPRRVLFYWHSVANKFLTTLSNMLTNINLTDMETCYKAFRADVITRFRIEENRFGFEPEITAKIAKMNVRIFEVPISYSGRTYAEGKKIGWKDGVRTLWCVLKYNLLR